MSNPSPKGLVLAVHPTARGFAWILFESPLTPVDWGITFARKSRGERLLKRFGRLLGRFEPAVLVLEELGAARRSATSEHLCETMQHLSRIQGMEVQVFRRSAIQAVFAQVGARSRYEIAEVVRQQIAAFSHRMPRKRTLVVREDSKQALFDAAAAAITYFAAASP